MIVSARETVMPKQSPLNNRSKKCSLMGIVKGDCFGITITRAETIIAPATEQCLNRARTFPMVLVYNSIQF